MRIKTETNLETSPIVPARGSLQLSKWWCFYSYLSVCYRWALYSYCVGTFNCSIAKNS